MVKENKFWYKEWWAITLFVIVGLIIIWSFLPHSVDDNSQPSQIEQKQILTAQQILEARQNYQVVVNDWESTGWESHYNPNTEKTMSSFWTKLDLSITNNNNPEFSLDWLTIRVNIKHLPGSDGIDTSWGRLTIDVNDIKSGESKSITVYYPGDLSAV
ncbi:MAG: hypothetical protein Q8R37_00530, partial [Nanoarchaeota archaeon]|nr:hypothetical protein [Nanoarchaeota archaeon]